jgi:DNA polymerase-3 subunit alpha
MYLIFDTETTGLPKNYNAPVSDSDNWPRLVQLAWQIHDEKGDLVEVKNYIVKPDGFEIPYGSEKIHGISTDRALKTGLELDFVLKEFNDALSKSKFVVGHNITFDINIMGAEFFRRDTDSVVTTIPYIDTKNESTDYCQLPGGRGGKFKWPNLTELHNKLFGESFAEAHNASADVEATARCFLELVRIGVITGQRLGVTPDVTEAFKQNNPSTIQLLGLNIQPYNPNDLDGDDVEEVEVIDDNVDVGEKADLTDVNYTHLHVHTQFSILDGAAAIPDLINKAKNDGMPAIAITDHGNMFGVKTFHKLATKAGIKPILGCEAYVARRSMDQKNDKVDAGGYHLILLAKNSTGYKNLIYMISKAWLDGQYYKPRIDKELLRERKEGIIVLSACLGGEIPQKIMNVGLDKADEAVQEFKEMFGDDFYLEMQRHKSGRPEMDKKVYDDQVFVNRHLVDLARKHNVKLIATNDVHFVNREDAGAHDRMICLSTGRDLDDPNRMRYTEQEWLKSQAEMKAIFADLPEAIVNTNEIVDKVEEYKLDTDPIMPDFHLPEGFETEDDYLRHLVYEGAHMRWGEELSDEHTERLDFELETIKKMGFPGYFLIVWDFIKAGREMGVSVGPGRGSAAGSAVAYCLRITEIDPVKYKLLFERFLNPDRISMPDIDIDFDDDGRGRVLEWVVNKYGETRVAHIITFGTMAAKSSIRDVARVQKLPLPESDRLAKMVPDKPGTSLKDAFAEVTEFKQERDSGTPEVRSVLKYAETLEGTVRNTGTHACGVIIGKDDLENYVPISTAKDSELTYVTQYDGKHVEDVGLLKMDFLGLKTLSIIKDAVENVKLSKDIDIDIDNIPLDDKETYELYSRGETTGLFQFESDGMKKYLKELKPTVFEDLIAMNALYRPGPMEYIPQFIKRKHGIEPIEYDLPVMEDDLKETYGITVYQEQVMLLSRKMAGFTRGQSDSLRKAMGKKLIDMMNDLKVKFVEGCKENGLDEKKVLKVWGDWEAFAKYAFNKSHATCYSYVSYQTAYLKAHYPGEFMAAVLTRNMNDIKKVAFFMDECKRMNLGVLGPSVNESYLRFTVNKDGDIRFGMEAIKGVGESAVEAIIKERNENGPFASIYDFVERVSLSAVNKKNMEALAYAGAFDCFESIKRDQFFSPDAKGVSFIENLSKYGNRIQSERMNSQQSLFGGIDSGFEIAKPQPTDTHQWSKLEKLNYEKQYTGFYHSAHPLDDFKLEIDNFCNVTLTDIKSPLELYNKDVCLAAMVTATRNGYTKNGKPFGILTIEDYTDSYEMPLFGKDYEEYRKYLYEGYILMIRGTIKERWGGYGRENEPKKEIDPSNLTLKIKTMGLINNAREELLKNITVTMSVHDITDSLIEEFCNITDTFPGKVNLNVTIVDPEKKFSVDMFSRTKRIELTNEFVDFLEGAGIKYKVS